jgi:hypothetical protein
MEVVHAAVGATSSSPGMTLLQQVSRFMVVAILNECAVWKVIEWKDPSSIFVPLMLLCWCLAEVNRYSYYVVNQLRSIATSAKGVGIALKMIKVKAVETADDPPFNIPYIMVWLRYSLFLVLYPVGVFSEIMCHWHCIDCVLNFTATPRSVDSWLLSTEYLMLNRLSREAYFGLILFVYILGLPALFGMMLGSRKKQLAPAPKTSAGKKKKSQ